MHTHKIIGLGLVVAFALQATSASALSCLPIDMYLDTVVNDETTQIFIGTGTEVKDHTQVVTVSKVLQGWVTPTIWVEHPYSEDWKYFCSNGPSKAGEATVFLTTMNEYGAYTVMQTLPLNSDYAKDLIKDIEVVDDIEAGLSEGIPEERADSLKQSMINLIKVLMNMLVEFKFWESKS